MAHVFIELYLDEDVDVLIAQIVRARGFDVVTTREANNLHASDDQQLAYAAAQGLTLLTHNRADFEALHHVYVASGREHAGLILAVRRPPYEVARRLLLILNQVTPDEIHNQIRYI